MQMRSFFFSHIRCTLLILFLFEIEFDLNKNKKVKIKKIKQNIKNKKLE